MSSAGTVVPVLGQVLPYNRKAVLQFRFRFHDCSVVVSQAQQTEQTQQQSRHRVMSQTGLLPACVSAAVCIYAAAAAPSSCSRDEGSIDGTSSSTSSGGSSGTVAVVLEQLPVVVQYR